MKRKLMSICRHAAAALAAVACLCVCACSGGQTYRVCDGVAWGTTYHIVYRADRQLDDSVTATMRRVELAVSPFDSLSAVSALNRGSDLVADTLLAFIIDRSRAVSRFTSGAFDPTVAPLVNLWGFGYRNTGHAPSDAEIDSARATIGIALCSVNSRGRLTRPHPATEFDFSAIAKGMGVDCVAAMLRRNGCTDYMVEIGGEVATRGVNASGRPWRISVDLPVADMNESRNGLCVIEPGNACMATSGNYRNYLTDSLGNTYGHTISPLSGRPVTNGLLSVTVMAPDCMTADALATAAMVAGCDSAMAWARRLDGVEVIAVVADTTAASRMRIVCSDPVPAMSLTAN